ncbi:hypothetical protein CYMTET_20873 [Cymbomonas tetramitiformis]|uniref:Uncharacterized protein n=1 Tax=Cymbomonas tetramitiformis TaxID=36881 RepID=A0AAE0L3T9_9CHLO|nr:hypothetical protein CYMTET_20873 [Cymbomonas tetramitiformis]
MRLQEATAAMAEAEDERKQLANLLQGAGSETTKQQTSPMARAEGMGSPTPGRGSPGRRPWVPSGKTEIPPAELSPPVGRGKLSPSALKHSRVQQSLLVNTDPVREQSQKARAAVEARLQSLEVDIQRPEAYARHTPHVTPQPVGSRTRLGSPPPRGRTSPRKGQGFQDTSQQGIPPLPASLHSPHYYTPPQLMPHQQQHGQASGSPVLFRRSNVVAAESVAVSALEHLEEKHCNLLQEHGLLEVPTALCYTAAAGRVVCFVGTRSASCFHCFLACMSDWLRRFPTGNLAVTTGRQTGRCQAAEVELHRVRHISNIERTTSSKNLAEETETLQACLIQKEALAAKVTTLEENAERAMKSKDRAVQEQIALQQLLEEQKWACKKKHDEYEAATSGSEARATEVQYLQSELERWREREASGERARMELEKELGRAPATSRDSLALLSPRTLAARAAAPKGESRGRKSDL